MKAKVFVGTSLDGFIARKNGDLAWLEAFANEEAQQAYNDFVTSIDAFVIGRGTFEKVLEFPQWPYNKPVFVLSKSLQRLPEALSGKVALTSLEPRGLMQWLQEKNFRSLYIDGGKVIQSFLREDLIDELTLSIVPVLIGEGVSLFGALERDLRFEHIRTEVQGNGLVRNYYVHHR